ncbi:hypothetical protein HPL003_08315 [Paenibacillus terrae HPL-003]|uniref:Uncharacterized protein n=1 Tax=Paenibacillus terrae (strain HPL-003) TaxID=985665 RepID=G7VX48_PAETH|nr:hypothetical protein HPL003_08315 [Paenibacillus terrae HPL-003]
MIVNFHEALPSSSATTPILITTGTLMAAVQLSQYIIQR